MIIVKLMGGLGNQMFQYALAKSMYMRGENVKLDITYYDRIPVGDTKRNYELPIFNCNIPLANRKEIKRYYNLFQILKLKVQRMVPFVKTNIVLEDNTKNEIDFLNIENKYLIGYWQNEIYFKDVRREILEDFSFDENLISSETREVLNRIKRVDLAVSIHIRGGDYLDSVNNCIYGNICTEDYYIRACKYFISKYSDVSFFVFSNDMELAKRYLQSIHNNVTFIEANTENNGWEDMFLMSNCAHNIIANSTFSWWAAWLNRNRNKEVVAPVRWTLNKSNESIIPSNWIRM